MKRRLVGVAAAVLGTVLVSGVGIQTAAAADPVPTEVMLPVFGATLTFTITTGPGGALTDVTVDNADALVATQLKPHKVVFESTNADSPGKVVVKSRNGTQSVSARAGSLADVSGGGSWSGDVFGDGTTTNVAFTVGELAGTPGAPDITGVTVAAGGAAGEVGDVKHSTGDDDEGTEMSASVAIKFTNADGDQSRTLTIRVKVEDDEGTTEAKLSISLGRIKGVAVAAAAAAGPHTWTGTLCDNTPATINYTVAEDGSVSDVTVDPTTADVRTEGSKIEVRFSHDERVRIRVRAQDGMIRIDVKERIRCDSPNPTTNVSTSIPGDDDNGDDGGHHGGGDHHGGDDDDTTTTTVV